MNRTRQQRGQKRHQRQVEQARQKAARRRMPAELDMSPEARFRRSRLGSHLGEQNRTITLATLKAYCGDFSSSLAMLEKLRKKKPLDVQIRLAMMNVRQLSGDFSPEQWHDPRILRRAQADGPQAPLWNGQPMPGETLLIWDIDTSPRKHTGPRGFGLGDIVQLARMVAPVKAQSQAAQVIFQVPKALVPLMHTLTGPDLIVGEVPATGFDKHLPLVLTPSHRAPDRYDFRERALSPRRARRDHPVGADLCGEALYPYRHPLYRGPTAHERTGALDPLEGARALTSRSRTRDGIASSGAHRRRWRSIPRSWTWATSTPSRSWRRPVRCIAWICSSPVIRARPI